MGVYLLDGLRPEMASSRLEGWIVVYAGGALGLAVMLVWLFSVVDVITAEEAECHGLPKLLWLVVVVLAGVVGAVLWLLLGRPASERSSSAPSPVALRYPEYDRPNRAVPVDPEADEAFLAGLRERAAAQRRREAQRRRVDPPRPGASERPKDQGDAGPAPAPEGSQVDPAEPSE